MKSLRNIFYYSILLTVWSTLGVPKPLFAEDALLVKQIQDLAGQMSRMQTMVSEMRGTIENQGRQIVQLQELAAAGPSGREIGADGRDSFQKNLESQIGDSGKWLRGLKFSGDLRLRYEGIASPKGSNVNDRNRFRFRLRFGFEKTWSDEIKAGFRLASGARQYNPTSTTPGSIDTAGAVTTTNQTLMNNFDHKEINIDRAYATYLPRWARSGPVEKFEMTAGKFANPFEEGSTMMIWDRDVAPEGAYERLEGKILKSERLNLGATLTGGQMVLQEGLATGADAQLFAVQGGLRPEWSPEGVQKPIAFKNLASWYWFDGITKSGNYVSAGYNPLQGQDLAAGGFKVFEVYNEVSTEFPKWKVPQVALYHDWARNLDENALTKVTGGGQDTAWSSGMRLGKAQKKGSWEAAYEYYWIEANATPSVFSDADLGGTNRCGSALKFYYALSDAMNVGTSMFFMDRLLQSDTSWGTDQRRDTYQIDLNWKF
ncbi:MAG: putative porin [Candidatus Omnitrophota bacterium]